MSALVFLLPQTLPGGGGGGGWVENGLGPGRIAAGHGGGWDPVVVPAALGLVARVCPAVLGWSLHRAPTSWRQEEELGRAVPSRCGETRVGRQLEAVPPLCSICGGRRSRCEAGLCSSEANPAAHLSRYSMGRFAASLTRFTSPLIRTGQSSVTVAGPRSPGGTRRPWAAGRS